MAQGVAFIDGAYVPAEEARITPSPPSGSSAPTDSSDVWIAETRRTPAEAIDPRVKNFNYWEKREAGWLGTRVTDLLAA